MARLRDSAVGIAFADYHHTLIVGIAEISLEDELLRVPDVWGDVDPGASHIAGKNLTMIVVWRCGHARVHPLPNDMPIAGMSGVIRFKVRIFLQDGLHSVSGSKLAQNVLHCYATTENDRFATENICGHNYAFKQFMFLVHVGVHR